MIDELKLSDFLADFADVWKEPGLWRIYFDGDCSDSAAITDAYLRSLSRPVSPREVFRHLVEDGSFAAAQALLKHPAFVQAIHDGTTAAELRSLLEHAQFIGEAEVQIRWDDLERRARAARVAFPGNDSIELAAYRLSHRDLLKAFEVLRPLEERIRAAEETRLQELQVAVAQKRSDLADDPRAEWWIENVEHALAHRMIDEAEALLEAGSDGQFASQPETEPPPPLPIGAFPLADAADISEWSLTERGGPPRFYQAWDPLRDGDAARPLISALHHLAITPRATVADATPFITELQRLLGEDQTGTVRAIEGGFATTLHGLGDVACAAFRSPGVDFYIQRKGARIDLPPAPSTPGIVFTLDRHAEPRNGYALLTPAPFFRALSRLRDIRFNLLRTLCSQVPDDRIFRSEEPPGPWPRDEWAPVPFVRLRALARRVLDLHGYEAAPPVINRIIFYAFGRPSLLYALLRGLFIEIDETGRGREAPITASTVDRAHDQAAYRRAVRARLLAPVDIDPELRLSFAAVLAVLHMSVNDPRKTGIFSVGDIDQWLQIEAVDVPAERIDAALAELENRRLLQRTDAGFRLSTTGGGHMAATLVSDRQLYWNEAKAKATS